MTPHEEFEAVMNSGAPIVDNANDRIWWHLEPDSYEDDTDDAPSHLPCKCSHTRADHTGGTGQCWSPVCGCASFREKDKA